MTKIFAVMTTTFQKYRARLNKNGFTILESAVVIGVLLAISVGGFVAYGKISESSKKNSVQEAAASVYSAAHASGLDGNSSTTPSTVQDVFNNSQGNIEVTVTITE